MQNFSIRERSGLAAVALSLFVFVVGGWTYHRQQTAPEAGDSLPPQGLMQISPPPPAVIEVPARGPEAPPGAAAEPPPPATSAAAEAGPAAVPPAKASGPIVVYVSGAVKRPGVYTLKAGDRIYHAVRAAGGFKGSAAQDEINLADTLRDADQVRVPARKAPERLPASPAPPDPEPTVVASVESAGAPRARGRVLGGGPPPSPRRPGAPASRGGGVAAGAGSSVTAERGAATAAPAKFKQPGDGSVDLNTATSDELQRLPGVGPAMAGRILAYRQEIGRFASVEQVQDVRGVGEKKFAALQPFVRVE